MILGTIGLPRSGKSTFIKKLMEKKNFSVVSRDSMRLALTGQRFFGPSEPFIKGIAEVMFKSLLDYNCDILIDETNITIDKRDQWRRVAGKNQIFGHRLI